MQNLHKHKEFRHNFFSNYLEVSDDNLKFNSEFIYCQQLHP